MNITTKCLPLVIATAICLSPAAISLNAEQGNIKCMTKNEHDEPVIIENGSVKSGGASVKMDFNRCDSPKVTGFLTDGGKYFYRGNAPTVKRIRVWLREKNDVYREKCCQADGNSAMEECTGPELGRNSVSLSLENRNVVSFDWRDKDQEGLLMSADSQRFKIDTAVPNPYGHRIISAGSQLRELRFLFKGTLQKFTRPDEGDIFIKICTKLGETHCSDKPE